MDVVLLHGFGEDASVWGEFVKKLPTEHQYHCPDFASLSHLKTISDYADWLKAFTDEKGLGKIILIGHSMGGYITLEFAKKHPGSIKGLGLFHSTAMPDSDEKKKNRDKTAAFIEKNGSEEFISGFYPNMFSEAFKKDNQKSIDKRKALSQKIPKEALIAATLAMKTRKDHQNTLKKLNVPVLQIIGGQDTFILKEQAIELSGLLQKPYVLVLDHVAHAGMFEASDLCGSFMSSFLENC
jgi:pimeloyl-ACP methyl ester carboxylesterase